MGSILDEIHIEEIRCISLEKGDVLKVLSKSDSGYRDFGEAYFSTIRPNAIKGWKLHKRMTMNLMVPSGEVTFVFFDQTNRNFKSFTIGEDYQHRLTVPPKIWFSFKGISEQKSLVLNIADIEHDPKEALSRDLSDIQFNWSEV